MLDGKARNLSPRDLKHGAVDRRRRREATTRNPAPDRELVPRTPLDAEARARPDSGPFRRYLPLHDHIGGLQVNASIQDPAQSCGRARERKIRDNAERLGRQGNTQDLVLDNQKVSAQSARKPRIELDCNHTRARTRERPASERRCRHQGRARGRPARLRPRERSPLRTRYCGESAAHAPSLARERPRTITIVMTARA
jgi:hypothetical protein